MLIGFPMPVTLFFFFFYGQAFIDILSHQSQAELMHKTNRTGSLTPVTLKVRFLDHKSQRCRQTCEKVHLLRPRPRGPESETLGGEWRAAIYILRNLRVIWMRTQVWEPLPCINFTVAGIKHLWGNRHNHFCDVPGSLSSGIYWLYLYISPVLGHLLRQG